MAHVHAGNNQHHRNDSGHERRERTDEALIPSTRERPHNFGGNRRRTLDECSSSATARVAVERIQLGSGLRRGGTRTKAPEPHHHPRDSPLFLFAHRAEARLNRRPEIRPQRCAHTDEPALCHTDDRVGVRAGSDHSTQDARAAGKLPLPDGIADHRGWLAVVREPAPE